MRAISARESRAHRVCALPGLLCALAFLPLSVYAEPPTPDSGVGAVVTNPLTGEEVEVEQVIQDNDGNIAYVLTSDDYVILTRTAVDDTFSCVEPEEDGSCDTYTVTAVTTDPDTGYVTDVEVQLVADDPPEPETQAVAKDSQISDEFEPGGPGDGEFIAPVTTAGTIEEVSRGENGDDGDTAYGVRICIIVCFNIGKSGSAGEDGETGPAIVRTVGEGHG